MIAEIVYRIKGYSLADAMRPDPFWGKRIYRVDTDKIGSEEPSEIWTAAVATPPSDRYECFTVQILPAGEMYFGPVKRSDKLADVVTGDANDC